LVGVTYSTGNIYYNKTTLFSNTGVFVSETDNIATSRGMLAAAGYGTDKAIFAYGNNNSDYLLLSSKVTNTGILGTDNTIAGTPRFALAAATYGGDKAIFGFGFSSDYSVVNTTNLFDNQGNYVSENSGVGTTRYDLAAASFGS